LAPEIRMPNLECHFYVRQYTLTDILTYIDKRENTNQSDAKAGMEYLIEYLIYRISISPNIPEILDQKLKL